MAYYEDVILHENGEVQCILCDTFIPDNNQFIEAHISNDRDHKKMFDKRLMLQNSIVLTDNKLRCLICKRDVESLSALTAHVLTSTHKSIMKSITNTVETDGAFIEMPENVPSRSIPYCSICDCDVNFTFDAVKDHISSSKHKRARSIIVQPFNGIFSVEGSNDDLWCKICQVYFENYVEVICKHVDEDAEHRTKLGNILKVIEEQNISIEKYLSIPREDKAYCMKCQIEVPCSVDNLSSHIKGKKHKN